MTRPNFDWVCDTCRSVVRGAMCVKCGKPTKQLSLMLEYTRLRTLNAELVEACEAHEAWAEAEDKHLGSFHDRMEIGNLSEYLTRKALAMVRGQEFIEQYKGVPQLIIRTNGKAEGS